MNCPVCNKCNYSINTCIVTNAMFLSELNPCDSSPCLNNGTCQWTGADNYTCTCAACGCANLMAFEHGDNCEYGMLYLLLYLPIL